MKRITELVAAAGGAVLAFFTGLPPIVWVLVAVMTLDYVTGLLCGLMGVSTKTEGGGLSSRTAFKGLLKKVLILCVVGLAALIDHALGQSTGAEIVAVTGATCFWFVASEGLSVLENAATIGVPIPKILLQALEIMKKKGGAGRDEDEDDDEI